MVRILKEYDERKSELLDAAQELFFEKGYEKTSVNTIIKKVGVSKGTFYYYFKSKVDLLDDLVEKRADQLMESWEEIIADENLNGLEKLNMILGSRENTDTADIELAKLYLKVMYKDENILMRHKMLKKWIEAGTIQFARIIEQGVQEGFFNTEFPKETMKLVLMLGSVVKDNMAGLIIEILESGGRNEAPIEKLLREYKVYENAVERILGAKEGSIKMVQREFFEEFLRE